MSVKFLDISIHVNQYKSSPSVRRSAVNFVFYNNGKKNEKNYFYNTKLITVKS